MATNSIVKEILDNYKLRFEDALRDSLAKSGRDSSHELIESIHAEVKVFGQSITLVIRMADYWKFVDKGVDGYSRAVGSPYKYKNNGIPIPKDSMLRFIADRDIVPTMNISAHKKSIVTTKRGLKRVDKKIAKKNLRTAYNSLAFALGHSIKKRGIMPTHFATDVMEGTLLDAFKKDITIAVGRDIKIQLNPQDLK